MHRRTVVAAALLLSAAPPLAAQTPPLYESDDPRPVPNAFLTITPYVGLRSPLLSDRTTTIVLPGAIPRMFELQSERRGGGIAGAEAELRFGSVGLVGSLAVSNPDQFLVTSQTDQGTITQTHADGPHVYFARAGISYRFADPGDEDGMRKYRPAAYIAIGPAVVRQDFDGGVLDLADEDNTVDSWALAISLKGVQTLGTDRLAVHFGIDDYVTFWDEDDAQQQRRLERFLDLRPGTVLDANFDYDETHVIMVHLGLSFRL
jgi:hypothetical protein